ncbi:MAG: undecaprenyl-diphosphate phosphatase [Ruminococcaceae bacterium]|nr:undecaprenyl-diphosphate phosphatase [Oscillospiraceae bacterium]
MDYLIEIIKSVCFGIVQGITEWLPISSTGHLILLEELISVGGDDFFDMFKVVIQFGSILAVVVVYFSTLMPLKKSQGKLALDMRSVRLWLKVIVGCIPAGVAGIILDDIIDEHLSEWYVIAATLLIYGIAFIVIERRNKKRSFKVETIDDISYRTAFGIGCFQVLALIPGTSRSGSTILGASLIGVSRKAAAEFSFFLAVPVMLGASALKLLKFGFDFSLAELLVLAVGSLTAFAVSLVAIKFLVGFVRKHSFESFGWYRIALSILVIIWFIIF